MIFAAGWELRDATGYAPPDIGAERSRMVKLDEPEAVIDALRRVRTAARDGERLSSTGRTAGFSR